MREHRSPPVFAFIDTRRPSHPRRRALRGPLVALVGAIALYVPPWVLPWLLAPSPGGGALRVYQVGQEGALREVPDGGAVGAGSKVAFRITSEREASGVVLGLLPRRVVRARPPQP